MRSFLILVLACSSPAKPPPTPPPAPEPAAQEPCLVVVDKLAGFMQRRFQIVLEAADREKALGECRGGDPIQIEVRDCVVAAADDEAIGACMDPRADRPNRKTAPD